MGLPQGPAIAVGSAIALLIVGAGLGASNTVVINVQALHLTMASIFIVLAPIIIYVHAKRFYRKGPGDWIAWTHFALLAVLLFIAGHMYRRWIPRKQLDASKEQEPVVARFKGETYDVTDFVQQHPGGVSNIMKAAGGELEKVWDENGVAWHAGNARVLNELKQRKI